MAIEGNKKEQQVQTEYKKRVGLFEAKVILINPTAEEYKDVLNIELKEDSKSVEYLGTSQDGNAFLRIDVWLEAIANQDRFKVTFFVEDKERENKDFTKKQYINALGSCAWAADENDLPEWFTKREYRIAKVGEEDLYNFIRTWLGELNYRDAETNISLEWKRLMKGNTKELRDQINGEYCTNIVALATINIKPKDGENREYQNIYNKGFLPAFSLRNFRVVNYADPKIINGLRTKKSKDLKAHERFVLNVTGEYGCKDYYILKDIQDYNADDNLVASNKAITSDGDDY